MRRAWIFLLLFPLIAWAQTFRPPPFVGGIPGRAQMQAIEMQRHQARTLLYREALEELQRNPSAPDVRECGPEDDADSLCLPPRRSIERVELLASHPTTRKIALLFSNHRYREPIPSLETPPHDVTEFAGLLRVKYGYDVRIVENATKATLVRTAAAMAREASLTDSVLIYYAGHGYLVDDTGMGYWIPVDGSEKSAASWLSNTDIAKLLGAIPARQLLLVSDSCFSGTLAREKVSAMAIPDAALTRRSVLVLSSGGEEPVADDGRDGHSIFAWHLLRTLGASGRINTGFEVYRSVRRGVSGDFPQDPQYGAVVASGHETGGEYLFERNAD